MHLLLCLGMPDCLCVAINKVCAEANLHIVSLPISSDRVSLTHTHTHTRWQCLVMSTGKLNYASRCPVAALTVALHRGPTQGC